MEPIGGWRKQYWEKSSAELKKEKLARCAARERYRAEQRRDAVLERAYGARRAAREREQMYREMSAVLDWRVQVVLVVWLVCLGLGGGLFVWLS